jgi:hypothetical protein
MMLSELGKEKELEDLLEYADQRLQPTWENGGLHYPRNDDLVNEEWNLLHVDPLYGNAGIGYARLNVENGQKKMWESPWTLDLLAGRPWVDGLNYADGIDFLRAFWNEEKAAMVVTMRSSSTQVRKVSVVARHLPAGQWAAYVDGRLTESSDLIYRGDFAVRVSVGEKDTDLIVQLATQIPG